MAELMLSLASVTDIVSVQQMLLIQHLWPNMLLNTVHVGLTGCIVHCKSVEDLSSLFKFTATTYF